MGFPAYDHTLSSICFGVIFLSKICLLAGEIHHSVRAVAEVNCVCARPYYGSRLLPSLPPFDAASIFSLPSFFSFLWVRADSIVQKTFVSSACKKTRTFLPFFLLLLSLLMPWWNKNTTVSVLPSLLADYLVRWTFGVSAEGGSCSNIGFGAPVESKTLSSCLPFKGSWLVSQFDREGGGSSNKSAEGIFTPWQARKGVTCFRVAISSSLQLLKQILKKIPCGIIRLYERFPSDWRDIIWYYLNNFVDDSDDDRDKIR